MESSGDLALPIVAQSSDTETLLESVKTPATRGFYKRKIIFAAVILISILIISSATFLKMNHSAMPAPFRDYPATSMSQILKDIDIYGEILFKPSNGRYAVCISGNEGELLLRHRFWQNLVDNVLTDQTDLFIYHETTDPIIQGVNDTYRAEDASSWSDAPENDHQFDINRLKAMYEPWLRSFVITTRNLDNEVTFYNQLSHRADSSRFGYDTSLRRFIKLSKCYSLLQSYEYFKDQEYEIIVQMRPDVLFAFPIDYSHLTEDDVLYTVLGYPTDNPRDDGLFLWTGNRIGIIDFAFFGSSLISRTLAQFLPLELASLENFPNDSSFPESVIKWVIVDRLHMRTKPTDLQKPLWGQIPTEQHPDPIKDPMIYLK
jgi:hypothetical protein